MQKRDLRIFSNSTRYGRWFFGSNYLKIVPSNIGYSNGLLKHKSNSILLGILNDKRNHRWVPTKGNYWNITIAFGKQNESNISNLSAIQKEYIPYPLGFGFGIKQISKGSIISATIGYGRGDPLSEGKLHIKFSSRL